MHPEEAVSQFAQRPIGEIATYLPGATAVFRKFRLDFCCGGEAMLAEAASRRGADLAAIERELQALDLDAESDVPAESGALIDYILSRYHEVHRRELPELIKLARKVEAVHADHPRAPRGLADILQQMAGEIEVHMKKEELILFPAITAGSRAGLTGPIAQMRLDHDDHSAHLRRIDELCDGFAPPEGACRSWQALYAGAAKLVSDVMEHICLENNVLFPRFE